MSRDWIAAQALPDGLRLWRMQGAEVLARRGLPGRPDCARLAAAVADWPGLPVLLAAPEDWPRQSGTTPEARSVPARFGLQLQRAEAAHPLTHPLWLVAPLTQADPPDRLAGGQAAIDGLLAAQPDFDGVLCLTGARSHWVRISAQEICHFHSFPTGELLAFLSGPETSPDPEAFDLALSEALSQPHRGYGCLARYRDGGQGSALAGALIGLELAAAKPYWLGQQVAILGAAPLAGLYARALGAQGVQALLPDADAALLAGLHAAWKGIATQG